jgi:hypothetical protein
MTEPTSPFENQLWYDKVSNKLRVWKTVNGITEWVNVNDTSIIPVLQYKIWSPDQGTNGQQNFIFHMTNDMNMRFVPALNEVEVLIDNGPLHSDQFEEITVADVINNIDLKQLLIAQYGYTDEWLSKANVAFENIGVGFKLAQPLDKNCYVEARVTHRVNDNPLRNRFQRSATFVAADSFYYKAENGKVITTDIHYKMLENQLEVFVDGRRLDPTIDYIEGVDLETSKRIKGATSSQFQIGIDIPENARISYKITTNVYSYDDVENVVGDLKDRITAAETTITQKSTEIDQHISTTNTNLLNMQNKLSTIETNEAEHATFIKKTDKLDSTNMSDAFNAWTPKALINMSIPKSDNIMQVTGISPEDFIEMFDIQATGGNSILRRDTDYNITRDTASGNVYINFINTEVVPNGHTLYLTGIKFKV